MCVKAEAASVGTHARPAPLTINPFCVKLCVVKPYVTKSGNLQKMVFVAAAEGIDSLRDGRRCLVLAST